MEKQEEDVHIEPIRHEREASRKSQRIEQARTCRRNLIDVEARVHQGSSSIHSVPEIASGNVAVLVWRIGKGSRRREGHVFFAELGVAAGFVEAGDFVVEGCVEVEEVLVGVDEGLDGDCVENRLALVVASVYGDKAYSALVQHRS